MERCDMRATKESLYFGDNLNHAALDRTGKTVTKIGFQVMPDTKLRATSTIKTKDKSSKKRFGHMNVRNRNSYLNIIFIKSVTQ